MNRPIQSENPGLILEYDTSRIIFAEEEEEARLVVSLTDVTQRRLLEEQLRQGQKMEAIGHLAGGVAHDFNNILAAMMMQVELAEMEENLPHSARELLAEIRRSTERAADLTKQLLLFSRRQVMTLRTVDLNEVVTNLMKMLRRMVREDVRLDVRLSATPLFIHADMSMIEQVLMNLAVNARDAMPNGGRLIIETAPRVVDAEQASLASEATPGPCAWISVTDTGCGIPPEIMSRIFDPFFTTKETGKGTGLGLATVFGIVKLHRGWLKVESQPGEGTVFQIFLPSGDPPSAAPEEQAVTPKPRRGSETILVVEDDQAVRVMMRVILQRHGYQVVEAPDGMEALKMWPARRSRISLLLTDLVMPEGLSGMELARALQEDKPELKVIFTSGYSAEIAGRPLDLEAGQNFVQKPCPPHELLEVVRRSLDG